MTIDYGSSVEKYLTRPENLIMLFELECKLPALKKASSLDELDAQGEFLMKPANFNTAQEMVGYLTPIKNSLRQAFWSEFGEALKQKGSADGWFIFLDDGRPAGHYVLKQKDGADGWLLTVPERHWFRQYEGCRILPRTEHKSPHLYLVFHQTNNRMNYGIARSEDRRKREALWQLPSVTHLLSQLTKQGFKHHLWWLGYKTAVTFDDETFWLSLAGDRVSFVKEWAETFWQLFLSHKELMEAANMELADKYRQATSLA